LRVLFLTGRETDYPRNNVLLRAFQRFADTVVLNGKRSDSIIIESVLGTTRALPRLLPKSYDLLFVGFYGHLMVLPLGLLSRAPVLFDAFVSTHDTLCHDRGRFAPGSLAGRLALRLDKASCHVADRVLLDSQSHIDYFAHQIGAPREKLRALPVGCNEDMFYPRPDHDSAHRISSTVLYYSSYLPLHGVDIVIRAAALLRDKPTQFRLIGTGQEYSTVSKLAQSLKLHNVQFLPSIPLQDLPEEIARADICLGGHFGTTPKAERVIPGKVYQIIAMGKPLIAADTPANRELLTHMETAHLCSRGSPEALASAIWELHRDPVLRSKLGDRGHELYKEACSEAKITEKLHQLALEMIG